MAKNFDKTLSSIKIMNKRNEKYDRRKCVRRFRSIRSELPIPRFSIPKKRTFDNYSTDFYTKLYLLRYTSSEIIQIKSPLLLKYMIDEYGEIFLDNVVK